MMSVAIVMPEDQTAAVVGNACLACLSLCRVYDRLPTEWRPGAAIFAAKLAGEKSQKNFEKKAELVEVTHENGSVTLTPAQRYGGGGFVHKADESVLISDGNPDCLGIGIKSFFKIST
jgi:hypothetical protein